MTFCEFIKDIDFFGKEPEFYFKGKPKQVTFIGRIFTIIFIILYIIIFCYKVYRMTQRVDITFYDSYSNTDEVPNIKITNENFSLAFAIFDEDNFPYIDESVYYPGAYFEDDETIDIDIELCDPDKLSPEFRNHFDDWELENLYCLNNINFELKPFLNSIRIDLFPCLGEGCATKDEINENLKNRLFNVYFQDIVLTPLNYDTPVKKRINYLNTEIFNGLGQYLHTEMQIVRIETSTNIIGFDFLTEPKTEEFIKFEHEEILPFPGYDLDDEDNTYPIGIFEIQLNDKIFSEKRYYIQLIDVLGEIGGLMEIIFSFFGVICSIVVDIIYEKTVTNDLFSFNIDKKFILFKKVNNPTYKINVIKSKDEKIKNAQEGIDIYTKNHEKNKEKEAIEQSLEDINFNNSLNNKRSGGGKKRKKNKVIVNEIKINNNKGNECLKINSNEKTIKNSNADLVYNLEKNINSKDEGINWTIDNINLTDLLISKFYCRYKRKKRSVYNLLINESMNIMAEKLDIFNILRNLCSIEYSNDDFVKNLDIIKMSEECSKDISYIIK